MVSYYFVSITEVGKYLSLNNVQQHWECASMVNSLARVKVSDRRPIILVLDRMFVYATLIISMNFSPYPNFCKAEKTKSQSTLLKIWQNLGILRKHFYSVYLECAKFRALRTKHALTCQRTLRPYVLTWKRALHIHVLKYQLSCVLMLSCVNMSCLLTCSCANVPCVLICLRAKGDLRA